MLKNISKYFNGKHATSNKVDQKFSSLKIMVNFRSRSSVYVWNLILNFRLKIQQFLDLVEEIIEDVKLFRRIARKSDSRFLRILGYSEEIKSEII
ncbi:MAG: hypothetical protein ACTSPY_15105 [Candidatus Helarchaeota archaeon]